MQIKRKCTLIFAIILGITIGSFFTSNAATFKDINDPSVFLKQAPQSDTCTLVAAAMMVRRAAMATGNTNWKSITEASMKPIAWTTGLKLDFSYAGISVSCERLPGGNSNTAVLIDLLSKHPEGVVIWNSKIPHAILLTDYTGGTFYCADPSSYIASGRIPISSASITVSSACQYWYVKSPKVSISNDTIKPTVTNAKVTKITKDGYTVTCTVSDNVGVTKVLMPTWTVNNGQDDLPPVDKWPKATINGNTATYTVRRADHNNESGTYITHIYADDAAGNRSEVVGVSATFSNQLPTGEITYAGPSEKWVSTYCVKGTAVDPDDKSKPVEVEIYELDSNGKETFATSEKTDPTTHIFETAGIMSEEQGNKTIRVYVLDCQTGEKVLLGTKEFYLKKVAKEIDIPLDNVNVRCGETLTLIINTDPVDAEETLTLWYDKENAFVVPEINGHTLTIKGLKKGKTIVKVIGEWATDSLTVNVIDSVCVHKYITVVEKEATCNAAGLSYELCSICGEKKAGSERTIPATGKHVKDTTVPPGIGWHNYGNCVYADVNTYKCAVCGAVIEEVGEKYTDHKMYVRVVGHEATCGAEGYYCQKCAVCGIEKPNSRTSIPATGKHTYTVVTTAEPTCGVLGEQCEKCSVCGTIKEGSQSIIPATGMHKFGEWKVVKPATVTEEGSKQRTCSVCGEIDTDVVAKLVAFMSDETDEEESLNASTASNILKTVTVKLNKKKKVTLKIDQKLRIKVKGIPKKEKVTFKSSNKKVAIVSAKGVVKVRKTGKTTITVKCGKKKAKITIKVKK